MITLKNHIGTVHELKILFECSRCAKKFKEEKFLRLHIEKVHTKASNEGTKVSPKNRKSKGFKCPNCEKELISRQNLENHMRKFHNGKKPYNCSVCGKGFDNEKTVESHIKYVHEEGPFQCSICDKIFECNKDLRVHNKVHKQKKVCNFYNCEFSTHQPSLMKRHVEQVHEGKVRHHCYQCTYQCWEESSMELHVSEKHKEIESSEIENLECKTCEVIFGAKDAFVDHMKQFHAVELELYEN